MRGVESVSALSNQSHGDYLRRIFHSWQQDPSAVRPILVPSGQRVVVVTPSKPWVDGIDPRAQYIVSAALRVTPGRANQRTLLVASRAIVYSDGYPRPVAGSERLASVGRARVPGTQQGLSENMFSQVTGSEEALCFVLAELAEGCLGMTRYIVVCLEEFYIIWLMYAPLLERGEEIEQSNYLRQGERSEPGGS